MRTPALTKSRFALGLQCPQKIVCEQEYPSQLNAGDSDFLSLLAEGGFQVGAFAKAHFPDGSDLTLLDTEAFFERDCGGRRLRRIGGSGCERLPEAIATFHDKCFSGTRFQRGKSKQGSNTTIRGRGALW